MPGYPTPFSVAISEAQASIDQLKTDQVTITFEDENHGTYKFELYLEGHSLGTDVALDLTHPDGETIRLENILLKRTYGSS